MKSLNWQLAIGILLLVFGGIFLLQSVNVLPEGGWYWAIPFILGGGAFLYLLARGKQNWWAAIPGVILTFLGLIIALDELSPHFLSKFTGPIFLFGMGLAFMIVYLMNIRFWWAIIPMGVMYTLTGVSLISDMTAYDGGAVFFFGLAVTFGLVAVLPNGGNSMRWPWIPALVLLVFGSIIAFEAGGLMTYVLPVVLILVGLFIVGMSLVRRKPVQ